MRTCFKTLFNLFHSALGDPEQEMGMKNIHGVQITKLFLSKVADLALSIRDNRYRFRDS